MPLTLPLSCLPPLHRRVLAALAGARRWALASLLAAMLGGGGTLALAWQADTMNQAAARLGPRAVAALPSLQALLASLGQGDDVEQLRRANRYFNERVQFRPDTEAWGVVDHWASPLEMLDKGEGDCEDYAIAKYLSLIATGMPVERLRLVYVRARTGAPGEPPTGQAHMVLAYYAQPQAVPLILDNLIPEIRPASQRPDLTPVFSFNSDGLWQGVGSTTAGDPLARLTRWRALLQKAREEGFF